MKAYKRIMAAALALALCLTVFPAGVLASDEPTAEPIPEAAEPSEAEFLPDAAEPAAEPAAPAEAEPAEDGASYVKVSEENFPDEIFRAIVSYGVDTDGSGYLSAAEIAAVESLGLDYGGDFPYFIYSLKGIEYFTSLQELSLRMQNVSELDLSGNTKLTYLDLFMNNMKTLDLTALTELEYLDCGTITQLTSLDLHGCAKLEYLDCSGDWSLSSLNMHGCAKLEYLDCNGDWSLSSLDMQGCTELVYFDCSNCYFKWLSAGMFPALEYLICGPNRISSLDVSQNPALIYLDCQGNALTQLDVTHNPALLYLNCGSNKNLRSLLLANENLLNLDCSCCGLAELDISKCPNLTALYCYGNSFQAVDISANDVLFYNLAVSDITRNGSGGNIIYEETGFNYQNEETGQTEFYPVIRIEQEKRIVMPGMTITGVCGGDASGEIGDSAAWVLEDGVLTITGTGSIAGLGDTYLLRKSDCSAVRIESGITKIGGAAFQNMSGITQVSLPEGLTSIGDSAFDGCAALTEISLPDSLRTIGKSAFRNCTGLKTITVPDSVVTIGNGAFCGCTSLESAVIGNGAAGLDTATFSGCSSLKSVVLGDGIKEIGVQAFYNCSALTEVRLPNGLKTIAEQAFWECSGLRELDLPEGLECIGDSAFIDTAITEITIPAGVESLGYAANALYGCSDLRTIRVAEGNTAYASIDGVLFSADKTTLIRFPQGRTGEYEIPDGVERIDDRAFEHSVIESVLICDGLADISDQAFFRCGNLTRVTIPASVCSMGLYAFLECNALADVYYGGSESQWEEITASVDHCIPRNTTVHFNSDLQTGKGDVDHSGAVDASDAALILRSLGGEPLPAADMDGDDAMTAYDAVLVLRRAVGLR